MALTTIDPKLKRAQSLVGSSPGRPDDDFYPTPAVGTQALMDVEKFTGEIWECGCGDGAMSRVLEANGYKVKSTDLTYRGYGETEPQDFLASTYVSDNIVTNPPFSLGQEFVEHALAQSTGKVAMLCKLQFLEGKKRTEMFKRTPFKKVWVFSKRLTLYRDGIKMKNSGMIAFAWFVWDKQFKGEPTVGWL